MKDKIKGGKADKMKPSDFDAEQLKIGTEHEMEHTDDKSVAQEIAMDHLSEDKDYYRKLKQIEKQDRVDEEADGKKELDYGDEDLEKRWGYLKKALDANKSIVDLAEAQEEDEEAEQDGAEQDGAEQDGAEQDEQMDEQMDDQDQEVGPEEPAGAETPEGADTQEDEEVDPEEAEQRLIEALKEEGHSDSEIAYIVHGHVPHQMGEDEYGAENEQMAGEQSRSNDQRDSDIESSHKQRMNDLEYDKAKSEVADPEVEKNHRSRMLDTEYEAAKKDVKAGDMDLDHKQRMLDLEYEKAKLEMEIEIENKKKESELKLRHAEENAKHKLSMQREQNKFKADEARKNMSQDAAKTSKKEVKGKQ